MRSIILIFIFFCSISGTAQQLNFAGHIIDNTVEEKSFQNDANNEFNSPITVPLKGSAKFRTHYGYITLQSNDDDALSVVRFYDDKGLFVKKLSFRQTINFTLSPDRKFAAFHDTKFIQWLDFENNSATQIDGLNVFAFSENNSFAFYNEINGFVHFDGKEIKTEKHVNDLFFYQGKLLINTKDEISIASGNSTQKIFFRPSENIFDMKVIGNKLFVSTKIIFSDHFEFNIYSTTDLLNFTSGESVNYPLKHVALQNRSAHKTYRSTTLPGEQIRNPIDYYTDTVYQPVGNSYDEIQDYSMGTSIYPHPGVDLLGTFMQDVVSVKTGIVKAVLTTSAEFHWRIAIGNENTSDSSTGYLYAHLEETSIPYSVGDSVMEGDVIGYLVDFPVNGFVHCHFARIYDAGFTWNGGWWTYDNPLSYMTNHFDSMPPVFEKTIGNDAFAFRDSAGTYLPADSLFGKIKIISKVYDQINSAWHVDVNKLRYSLSPLSNPQSLLLDTFAYEFNFYNDNYNAGPYMHGLLRTIYSFDQTCFSVGNYTDRNFYHMITNSDGNDTIDGTDSLQFFDTGIYADGDYIFRVIASDPSGNTAMDSMIIKIRNLSTEISSIDESGMITLSPNPFDRFIQVNFNHENIRVNNLSVKEISGKEVYYTSNIITKEKFFQLDLSALASGVYFISFEYGNRKFSGKIIGK